ncbi:hypothetical protein [Solitalea canadensis]|uniref:Uncharacterized protein n=1 Tax=Solitalea canadensis (strain ATCC 29591 / DSM 3403 / JCM 21819 / LMG 8368 / NBRC 15130 / NCIMB 12057 / USAM 9D) TaxID=929556 RepID=H8KSN1_SOLCM|nr:hypothetical protein [Solitalea canadensis]AFD08582.1 hypothetical protein Solca_3578 [Solitalea canadensis DSM 3403]
MGMFLSITGVIGKAQEEVLSSLTKYAKSVGGGLEKEVLSTDNYNCSIIESVNGNTTIIYPNNYLEWDTSSEFISKDLNTPVFSFHIHDGDLWMYVLFVNGEIVDQFNPIPDYWDGNISDDEIQSWKGSATIINKYVEFVKPEDIEKYLVRWDLDIETGEKAYEGDEFVQEDWQLLDFMKKMRLPFPLNEKWQPNATTFKLWTKELSLKQSNPNGTKVPINVIKKPWWKIW